jgi:outer membrane protein assembly factor BamE (lipoprotein component of BamABCDE complex)
MKKVMTLILLAGLLAGCASTGRKIDQSAADKIEKGKTTKAGVISLIGSPELITRKSNGDTIFVYNYTRATAKPATFIPYIGPFVGGANVQHQSTSVTFGPDGVVKDFSSTQGATESDMGLTSGGKPDIPDVELDKRPK